VAETAWVLAANDARKVEAAVREQQEGLETQSAEPSDPDLTVKLTTTARAGSTGGKGSPSGRTHRRQGLVDQAKCPDSGYRTTRGGKPKRVLRLVVGSVRHHLCLGICTNSEADAPTRTTRSRSLAS
jgi:hypothetical protein